MKKKSDLTAIIEPLRNALLAYADLEPNGAPRAVIAQGLFGPTRARTLMPLLDELARSVRPATKAIG